MPMTLALGLKITLMANATRHVRFTPCCMLLRGVGSCCAKFDTGQTFSHVPGETTPNIVGQQCWELLRPFARSLKVILNLSNSIFPPRVIFLILLAGGNFDAFSFTSLAI